MFLKRHAAEPAILGLLVIAASAVCAQNYPLRPVRVVAPEAGGGADFTARLVAQEMTTSLGQQVIVDNRGGGVIAIDIVAKAPSDGYTLLVFGPPLWIQPLLQRTSYDPVRDFAPIALVANSPNVLTVHPLLPAKTIEQLIAIAKAKPGELNYSSAPAGASSHLSAELFKTMAGINIVHIPYKGSGPALTALIGGEVQLMFAPAASVMPHLKSGRLRALAVTSAQPSALTPGLPTLAGSGLPDYVSTTMFGMFAPVKTPASLITLLNQVVVRAINKPEVKQQFLNAGAETFSGSPAQLDAMIKTEMARMGQVIKLGGISAD